MDDNSQPNMVAALADSITNRLIPDMFQIGEDLEKFISRCRRYFEAAEINQKKWQTCIYSMIHEDLLEAYENTAGKADNFEDRLRLAFEKPRAAATDWEKLLSYRKGADNAQTFFKKVDRLVKNALSHRLEEEELKAQMLIHCIDDEDVVREIKLRKLKSVKEISEFVALVDEINHEKKSRINAVRSYRDVVQNSRAPEVTKKWVNQTQSRKQLPREESTESKCYTCHQPGHFSRNCQQRRPVQCWNCKETGHISRNCPNRQPLVCFLCGKKGHKRTQCPEIRCEKCGRNGHLAAACLVNSSRQNNGYDNGRSRMQYNDRKFKINTMNEDEERTFDDNEEKNDKTYPNDWAPPIGELVGAECH